MPRPLRIESSEGFYHCMNRGTDRCLIAENNDDFSVFLKTLEELHKCFGIQVFAFCLMSNHYHLLLRAPQNNLSRGMRHFGHSYTQRYNLKHQRDGVLFRGRYRALLVLEDEYIAQVLRYIHLNPVKAGIVTAPELYAWSSHSIYTSGIEHPWLLAGEMLQRFGPWDREDQISLYKKFISDGNRVALEAFFDRRRLPPILSSDAVIKTLESRLKHYRPGT